MTVYNKEQKWKKWLLLFAILIAAFSIIFTNNLVKELKKEERKKIELWAQATKNLVNISSDGDFSLAINVITENKKIPLILVDECDSILEYRNLITYSKLDSLLTFRVKLFKEKKITNNFLKQELKLMKEENSTPIEVNFIGDKQFIYYKDSNILSMLRYYPFYQLGFILIFFIIAYIIFSSAKKSEQNKVWAGMAKETAHQLATPLSSLIAWSELLKDSEINTETLNEINKDLRRLETITDRFSKIGSVPALKNYQINELLGNFLEYLEKRLPQKIEIIKKFPEDSIFVSANKTLFEWAIENLCKNATDAMKGNGKIEFDVTSNDYEVNIFIKDYGQGIAKNKINQIFLPGYTSKKSGWGLGLSLTKRIVEEYHNGKIFVSSSEENYGTTFCIKLKKV
ncbi:MAG: sensor histidine kinase [Flavobacteriales bacterium TMED84]|nr:MAG: sensor histidine kinase [Flavobacteriales bacterium TMED84]|tara:strand:- start:6746 stop:7942 length:1197 start_codon:yes stop_codon:yes gene_type:complete